MLAEIYLGEIKKKKKKAISITVDADNLDYLKQEMEKKGGEDIPLSLIFDILLRDFTDFMRSRKNKKITKKK